MNSIQHELLKVLSKAIYNGPQRNLPDSVIQAADRCGVLALVKEEAIETIANSVRVIWEQNEVDKVLDGVEYVALGGFAYAVYYQDPLRRVARGIEIAASKPEAAYDALLAAGYEPHGDLDGNVVCFSRNGVAVILQMKSEDWIAEGIVRRKRAKIDKYDFWILPDPVNGLVLLREMSCGISLSNTVDWVMYVNHCLRDDQWEKFRKEAERFNLVDLARRAARFGQEYLGLDQSIQWCRNVAVSGFASRILRVCPWFEEQRSRPLLHKAYLAILNSPLWMPAYYVVDLSYVLRHWMMGKADISEDDRKSVEKNVTFIYKSFNRQRQAKRLYRSIKSNYPNARVIIADDSARPLELEGVIHLPFNSGLSKGLIAALEQVDTPYVMRLDDDELLTPRTNVHGQLVYLNRHSEVDLVAIQAKYKVPERSAWRASRLRMDKNLLIPSGTVIDGREVVYKPTNVFLARTDKVRQIGYDPNIQILDHYEFFYRAAGRIVCVQDYHASVMHCHNRFDKHYNSFRKDTWRDEEYIGRKHGG